MKLAVLGTGTARLEDVSALRRLPAFRKATTSMALASASIEAALKSEFVRALLHARASSFGLVLASAFGELETTKDFLQTYSDTKMARPLLFQNSLHNSTCGFLSIYYKITGPAVTVSHGHFASEQALEAANILLSQSLCDFCLVTTVETFVSELVDNAEKLVPFENAATLVLSREKQVNQTPLAFIEDVTCSRRAEPNLQRRGASHRAGRNSLYEIVNRLSQPAAQSIGKNSQQEELSQTHHDAGGSSHSVIEWSRP